MLFSTLVLQSNMSVDCMYSDEQATGKAGIGGYRLLTYPTLPYLPYLPEKSSILLRR